MTGDRPPSYPVNLLLAGVPVLVVGAGAVSLRKIRRLLDCGARVTVVAPEARQEIHAFAAARQVVLHVRPYAAGEAGSGDHRLIFAATGVPEVDRQVSADARQAGRFVNVADVPELCSFYLPAIVGRGHLQVAINTDGLAPFASRRLRQRLVAQIGPEFESWLVAAWAFRKAVLSAQPPLGHAAREALFDRFFVETLPVGSWTVRAPAEHEWRGWIAAAQSCSRGSTKEDRP